MFDKNEANRDGAALNTSGDDESVNESEDDMYDYNKRQGFGKSKNIYTNIYKDSTSWYPGIWFLLLRWRGSVYKLLWVDFATFTASYAAVALFYRCVLMHYPEYRQNFELFCVFAQRFSNNIPITFLIGLYVSAVVERWWSQFMALPWPDQLAMKLVTFMPGDVSLFMHKIWFFTLCLFFNRSNTPCDFTLH